MDALENQTDRIGFNSTMDSMIIFLSCTFRYSKGGLVRLYKYSILNLGYHGKKMIVRGDNEANRTGKGDEEWDRRM
jgi:hypothetical protein